MPVRIIFMNGHCIIFVARSLHKVRKAKFNKSESECKKSLYYWLYNLRNMEQSEQEQNTVFTRLEEVARIDNLSKDERAEYEASLKAYHDNNFGQGGRNPDWRRKRLEERPNGRSGRRSIRSYPSDETKWLFF